VGDARAGGGDGRVQKECGDMRKPARTLTGELTRSVVKVVVATAAYAGLHSALASSQAKEAAARVLGTPARNGLYRAAYNAQAVVTFAALLGYLLPQPDRVLYRLTGPAAVAARVGQLLGWAWAVAAAWEVGVLRITGLAELGAWARAVARPKNSGGYERLVEPEPEAQGPAPDGVGELRTGGLFRWSRHPLNFAPVPIALLAPTMTLKRATFGVVALVYLVVGSRHEEARLARAYGERYARYQRSGVPFYVPWVGGTSRRGR
jgi:protein-S-isoprenylcysteine O-methyltransferase Ste14